MPDADPRETDERALAPGADPGALVLIGTGRRGGFDGGEGRLPHGLQSVRVAGEPLPPEGLAQRILAQLGAPPMQEPGPVLAAYAAHLRACGRGLVLALDGPELLPEATLRWLGALVRRARGSLRLVLAGGEAARLSGVLATLGLETQELPLGSPGTRQARRLPRAVATAALSATLAGGLWLAGAPPDSLWGHVQPDLPPRKTLAPAPPALPRAEPPPAPAPAPFERWSYDRDADRISFSVRGAPLETVLGVLARESGFELTSHVGNRLRSAVTLEVEALPLESAVRTLLGDFQAGFVLEGEAGAPLRLVSVRVLAERPGDLANAGAPGS